MKKRNINIFIISIVILIILLSGLYIFMPPGMNKNPNIPYTRLQYYGGSGSAAYKLPGEFEKQQAIWLQWPSAVYNSNTRPVNPVMINIIKSLAPYIRVNIASQNTGEIVQIRNMLTSSGYKGTNVHFYIVGHLSIWARDVGPIFVKDNMNKFRAIDFGFNNYSRDGSQYYINVENLVHKSIAKLYGAPLTGTSLISEGGSMESNGRGTLMLTESVALKRNPGMTKQMIENEYKRVLGVKKIIWLKKGLAEDDNITSGHINEIARFAGPDTILLAKVLPGDRYANNYSKESYLRLEENYRILQNSTDQNGKPFRIIRIPMPPTLYNVTDNKGRLPVRSYLNYAVTNGAVLMQVYWKPGYSDDLKATENGVKEILRGVFPGRNIIGIDAENINLWGGGIHCVTLHVPA